jgi:hypothetical protein
MPIRLAPYVTLLASVPPLPPPEGLDHWLACLAYVLAAVWLVMQIVTTARGKAGDWATRRELELAIGGVNDGSLGRAKTNGDKIDALSKEGEKRDEDRVKRLTALHEELAGLSKSVQEGFRNMQRALGKLEGYNQAEDGRRRGS